MHVNEIKEKKIELKEEIEKLLMRFEKETLCKVVDLRIGSTPTGHGTEVVKKIELEVRI